MSVKLRVDVSDLLAKVAALEKKIRNKALRQCAGEAAKVMKPVMKAAVPVRSGWLKKSIQPKIKIYTGTFTSWAGVGPKAGFKVLLRRVKKKRRTVFITDLTLQYKGKKLLKFTAPKSGLGAGAAGQFLHWPSKIAHLAGPGRRQRFLQATVNSSRAGVKAAYGRVLRNALQLT